MQTSSLSSVAVVSTSTTFAAAVAELTAFLNVWCVPSTYYKWDDGRVWGTLGENPLKPHGDTGWTRSSWAGVGCSVFRGWVVPPSMVEVYERLVSAVESARNAWEEVECEEEVYRTSFDGRYEEYLSL